MPPDALAAVFCREFGWTYQQYQETPWHFIQTLLDMFAADRRAAERNSKLKR